MRNAFILTLSERAAKDPNIWLLCGDLGFSVLEDFASQFPERFVNIGVAEQNMTGVAAGLALSGKVVFTYSIANFPTFRCLEQIRNDVCYHKLSVKIVSVGGGFSYGSAGYTHHGLEDIAVMRVLPNMTIFAPGDPIEARQAAIACIETDGPCYLRLGKGGEKRVRDEDSTTNVRKASVLSKGDDVTILASAGTLALAQETVNRLLLEGIRADFLSVPCLQPFDTEALVRSVSRTGRIVTIEAHGPGGLGTIVAEFIALSGLAVRFRPVRFDGPPVVSAGSQEELNKAGGLSIENAVNSVLSLF